MADVKYKSVAEIKAAVEALNGKFDQFTELNDYALQYQSLDLYAADALEKRNAISDKAKPAYVSAAQEYNIIHPEVMAIVDSINALPNKFGFNTERDVLLAKGSNLVNLDSLASRQIDDFRSVATASKSKLDEIIAARDSGQTPTPPAAEPTPASASDTATNQVANTNPQAASNNGSNSTPANVPENQLSGSQQNNLIKAQSGQGGSANPDDAGTAVGSNKSEATTSDKINLPKVPVGAEKQRKNVLLQYPSYTYALSLHLLDSDTFNAMVDSGEYSATNVLIASAGRWNDSTGSKAFNRNARFKEDFYFEDLDLYTIIGLGETNRATNAIEGKFTIIEPYGFTLLNRIMKASKDIGILNYAQNPYMLQIDFYATEEDGTVVSPIPEITKNIPISIRTLEAEVTTKGSEYKITCTAFNHQAFDNLTTQTPINAEVVAKNVEGFFKSSLDSAQALAAQIVSDTNEREEYYKNLQDAKERAAMNNTVIPDIAISSHRYSKDPWYKTNSFGDILNAHQLAIRARQNLIFVDSYQFKFDQEIGSAELIKDEKISPSDRPMQDLKETYSRAAAGLGGEVSAFGSKEVRTTINYGSSIDAIISRVVRNSSYITGQLNNIANQLSQKKYTDGKDAIEDIGLKWYKIIPSIKLLGFDPYTNTFAREITYNVVPYMIYNVKIDEAPNRKVTKEDCVKYYEYIFTGNNNDILDLKLNINSAYFTSITAYKESMATISGTEMYYDTGTSCEGIQKPKSKFTVQPKQIRYKLPDQRDASSSRAKSPEEITAADLERSIHVDARGDMLYCTLKIIGDPEFIKQDDLFIKPKLNDQGYIVREWDTTRTKNGSIKTDNGEVYVTLNLRTPVDIDDETGMMKFDNDSVSAFSGVYRVLEVHNYFNRGQFLQDLTIVRMDDQEPDEAPDKNRPLAPAGQQESPQASQPNNITPEEVPPQSDALPEAQDETNESQPEPEPIPDPTPDASQADLANVRDNAPEAPITQNTEPQTSQPILENISFAEAFKRARAANGGKAGAQFEWNGTMYQTNTVGEAYVSTPTTVQYNKTLRG